MSGRTYAEWEAGMSEEERQKLNEIAADPVLARAWLIRLMVYRVESEYAWMKMKKFFGMDKKTDDSEE